MADRGLHEFGAGGYISGCQALSVPRTGLSRRSDGVFSLGGLTADLNEMAFSEGWILLALTGDDR